MADPRDELVDPILSNEPGFLPPREPLRIRVSPYDTPPPVVDPGKGAFNPEGTDYDYAGAAAAGITPDATGHWATRDPNTGLILKGTGHETFGKTIAGEDAAGYEIIKRGDRYYSSPKGGWGAPDQETGRPAARLFEPDQAPAPPAPIPRPSMIDALRTQNPAVDTRPGLPSLGESFGKLGSLVSGAGAYLNQPLQQAPPRAPVDPTVGPRQMWQQGYPSPQQPTLLQRGVTEGLNIPWRAVETSKGQFDVQADPAEVDARRQAQVGAVTDVTSNLAGAGMAGASIRGGASAGLFGGRLAKGFDPNREKLAATMEANGVPAPQIWKETGMVKFADGKWAHEISDLGAYYVGDNFKTRLKIQQGEQLYLPDVWHHPELFKRYPELLKMPVSQDAMMHAQGAYFPHSVAGTDVRPASIMYREEHQPGKMARGATFDTLLHEIQHAIAQIEGFAKGSNTHQMQSLLPGTGANKIYQEEMKKFTKPMSEEEYLSKYPATTKKEYADYMDDYRKRLSAHEDFIQQYAAEQAYPKSAGENVAELPPLRKDLTPEQAAAIPPPSQFRVPMDQQFVEYNRLVNPQGTAPQQMGGLVRPMIIRDAGVRTGHDNVAGLTKPDHVYRGMEAAEFDATIGAGKGVRSRQDFSTPGEGTSWAKDAETAESYVNFGRSDPRVTDKPTYLVEAKGGEDLKLTRDGYLKTNQEIGRDRITRVIEMRREGDKIVGREVWPQHEGPQLSAGPTLRGKAAEQAWRGTEKEPKLRTSVHPYSNVGGTPIREMESPIIKGASKAPPRLLDVEKDLSNAEFIFTGGDATGAGGKLYGSKSMPFDAPVSRFGGPGYAQIMQGKTIEGAPGVSPVWATMKAPMGEIFNLARDVERRGKEPWQVYMTGGKQYLDSSMQMVDTALQAAKAKGVSDRMNEYLFNVMRSDWNTAADPKRLFPETGLKNEKALREWIDNSPQPQRAKLVKAMDSVTARSLGFPDMGQLRVWNTDPRMLTAPPGSAGLSLARLEPSLGPVPSHHPSYATGIAGRDVGTLGMQVPHQIIAPTMHESRMATLNKPQYYTAAPHLYFPGGGTHAAKTEPVTNKLKDILQRWMLDNPGGLAVAGTAGGLGSLVAPNRQEVY
jgi:hypothetical protein